LTVTPVAARSALAFHVPRTEALFSVAAALCVTVTAGAVRVPMSTLLKVLLPVTVCVPAPVRAPLFTVAPL
jgi:hypothetical protein